MTEFHSGSVKADHLCVLVHGLWGTPKHMRAMAQSLRAQYSEDKLHILVPKRNQGTFTYDGIETGGERACAEIEEEIAAIEKRGGKVTKLSVVGYSLGGLVARFAIGLLHAKGTLDGLECMNFTAFASPFLGVRSPTKGVMGRLWNTIGPRSLSSSGQQLFGVDSFRDTGRPLVAVLADPKSIFMAGLARFKRRVLYANIINDRTANYFTTHISKTDPYTDLSKVNFKYVEGYENTILDPYDPVSPAPTMQDVLPQTSWTETVGDVLKQLPMLMAFTVFIPIGLTVLMGSAGVQAIQSPRRRKLHDSGRAGIDVAAYRMSVWMKEMRGSVEDAYEAVHGAQQPDYLSAASSDSESDSLGDGPLRLKKQKSHAFAPTLALADYQFEAIQNLDNLGWRKFPVWIKFRHSHAAIIRRSDADNYKEGETVLAHWTKEEFLI